MIRPYTYQDFLHIDDDCGIYRFMMVYKLYANGLIDSTRYSYDDVDEIFEDELDSYDVSFNWSLDKMEAFINYFSRSSRDVDLLARLYQKICGYAREYPDILPGGIMVVYPRQSYIRPLYQGDELLDGVDGSKTLILGEVRYLLSLYSE